MRRHGYYKVTILHSKVKMSGNRVAELCFISNSVHCWGRIENFSVLRLRVYLTVPSGFRSAHSALGLDVFPCSEKISSPAIGNIVWKGHILTEVYKIDDCLN